MSITILTDVVLPNSIIAAGIRGRQIRNNTRTQGLNGNQKININWAKTLRQYELGIVPMSIQQWEAVEGLFEVTDAGAYGFLMQDPKDQQIDAAEGLLYPMIGASYVGTIGLGYGVPTMRIHKRYTSAGSTRTRDRAITRPIANTITLKRGGVTVVLGGGAGNASIDTTTGIVTFVADASQAMSSITVGATTVLNFATTSLPAQMAAAGRVYITGVSGTAAATLNGLSHLISSVGATSITISTATTGLTATGGTGFKYPQPSEALTCAAGFYVPVHFSNDSIDWELIASGPLDSRLLAGPTVTLDEVRE